MEHLFGRVARYSSIQMGKSYSFIAAVLIVVIWGATGPVFGYSDTWQLIINTGTTVITFWMVFLLQHTQNHDTVALQLKLDELLASNKGARNEMIQLEDLTEEELEKLREQFALLAQRYPGRFSLNASAARGVREGEEC